MHLGDLGFRGVLSGQAEREETPRAPDLTGLSASEARTLSEAYGTYIDVQLDVQNI